MPCLACPEAVREGKLREDLYYRLAVFPIDMPPLRERTGDVVLLARHFLECLNGDTGTSNTFSDQVLDWMQSYSWPGNVRELRNYVWRAYIMAMADGDEIGLAGVPSGLMLNDLAAGCDEISQLVGATLADRLEHYAKQGYATPSVPGSEPEPKEPSTQEPST